MKNGMHATSQVQGKYVVSVVNQQGFAKRMPHGPMMASLCVQNVIDFKTKGTIVNKDISRKTRRDYANNKKSIQLIDGGIRKPKRKPYRRAKSGSSKDVYYMEG